MRANHQRWSRRLALASAAALLGFPALAQPASQPSPAADQPVVGRDPTRETEDGVVVSEIVVRGQALRGRDNAFSTTSFGARDIQERRVIEIEQVFREVPGMNVRDYNLSGVANQIVIRGFGNGAHGGDLGMVVDGIPLNEANSHADGYVDSNVLIPLEIGGLTVYRGPVSALYGNFNRGGLIAYETRKGGDYAEADVSAGDFRTFDVQGAFGAAFGPNVQVNGAVQAFTSDGFRPQSQSQRITASGRVAIAVTEQLDLSLAARLQDAHGDSPAYLTLGQFQRDPYGIDPRVMNDGSEKQFGTFRADLAYTINPDLRLLGFAYTTQQEFTRFFTRGAVTAPAWRQREEAYQRRVYGTGFSLNGRSDLLSRRVTYVAGVDLFSEDTDYQFYDDLRFRVRTAPAQFNRTLGLDSVALYGEANVTLTDIIQVSLGLRYDRFTGDCTRNGTEAPVTDCAEFQSVDNISPKVGVRAQVLPWLQLRASFSRGFALPEAQAKFQTGAQGLEPNQIEQVEAGFRITPIETLDLDVVGYRITSSNEFASTAPGVFINFGETLRSGVEATARWRPFEFVELRAIYAHTDSEVRENLNSALVGRMITGVPDDTVTLTAEWRPVPRLRLNAAYRYVGEYATDALNTVYAPSYDIVDVGASYDLEGLPVATRVYLNVDNVGDEVYASSFNSLGSIATGTPRFVRAGVQVGF